MNHTAFAEDVCKLAGLNPEDVVHLTVTISSGEQTEIVAMLAKECGDDINVNTQKYRVVPNEV